MKKITSVLLVLVMVLSVVGCKSKPETSTESSVSSTVSTQNPISSSTDPSSGTSVSTGTVSPSTGSVVTTTTTGGIELTGIIKAPADGIGTPGVDFPIPETGSVTGWDEFEAPFFNPLGDYSMYSYIEYVKDGFMYFEYLDTDGVTPVSATVYGNHYSIYMNGEGYTKNWLTYLAKNLGGTIYPTYDDRFSFSFDGGNNFVWWVSGTITYDGTYAGIYFDVCKTLFLKSGDSVTVSTDFELCDSEGNFHFMTDVTPGVYKSLEYKFNNSWDDPEKGIYLVTDGMECYGEYKIAYKYHHSDSTSYYPVSPRFSDRFCVDDIPISGFPVSWKVGNCGLESGDSITFSLYDTDKIEPIVYGENLGQIELVGFSTSAGAVVEPMWNAEMSHPEIDPYCAYNNPYRNEEGNYSFSLPTGYYKLILGEEDFGGDTPIITRLVPVSAGKVTKVICPNEFKGTYSELLKLYGNEEKTLGNIEILDVKDEGDSAKVTILVHDSKERDIFPEIGDFTIAENGVEGVATAIDRQVAGVNVALCIDSSGSMKSSMKAAIKAAQDFVQTLPDNASITVIQFCDKLTVTKAKNKEEAITAIGKITSKGGTALYDATAKALDLVSELDNPYVVIFADGADSSEPGVSGTGSKISQDTVVSKIEESNACVLSIGFGKEHDPRALKRMSEASNNGAYFVAADESELGKAFASVSAKFGNQFVVTYTRPTIVLDTDSDVPVVSFMIDRSGSMDMDPDSEFDDVDYRIDKVKTIFHDFVLGLPDNTLIQSASFTEGNLTSTVTGIDQITTTSKARILSAIDSLVAEGGTPVLEALNKAYAQLDPITSTKRVLVFFTDAGLEVEEDGSGANKMLFEDVLTRMKEEGIRVLFAGLGGEDYAREHQDVFKNAAELAGGDYIISSSVDDIRKKLDELLTLVNQPVAPKPETVKLSVSFNARAEDGTFADYSASQTIENFYVKTTTGKAVQPGAIALDMSEDFIRYDSDGAALLYGSTSDTQTDKTVIANRLSFESATGSNQFIDINIKDAYFMSAFRGLENGKMFLGLNMSVTFHKKDKSMAEVEYNVPSIFNHFYVSVNNNSPAPASKATWLANTPLLVPGESGFLVSELYEDDKKTPREIGETIEGMAIFMLDVSSSGYDSWDQLSFHMYDTSYGHIHIPIIGALPAELTNIEALPKAETEDISDTYSLSVTGMTDTHVIDGNEIPSYVEDITFRVFEMQFKSKVQALLDIDPMKRFYYSIATDNGDLMVPMSNAVYTLPLGFTGATRFAPGSSQTVRMPYITPVDMLSNKGSLVSELSSGLKYMDVKSGSVWNSGRNPVTFDSEYFTLSINELAYFDDDKDCVVLDFTVTDKKDGQGVGGFDSILQLRRDDSAYSLENGGAEVNAVVSKGLGNFGDFSDLFSPAGVCFADAYSTQNYLFGASYEDLDWGAFDGQSRRGVLIFSPGYDSYTEDWRLESDLIPGMSVEISNKPFSNKVLLTEKYNFPYNREFEEKLNALCDFAVTKYRATHPETEIVESVGITDDEIIGQHVPTPYLTTYGTNVLEGVKTYRDFENVMNSLTWLPYYGDRKPYFSPEAVISQGKGYDEDFYRLAEKMLTGLGYTVSRRSYAVTPAGIENLERLGNFKYESGSLIVGAISYTDENGKAHLYVPAFRHEATEINGLGYVSSEPLYPYSENTVHLQVSVSGYMTEAASLAASQAMMADIGGILGGASETEDGFYDTVTLLDAEVELSKICDDFCDISFVSLGKTEDGIHDKITAVCDCPAGFLKDGALWVDSGSYNFDRIDITVDDYTHTLMLDEDESLLDIFQSVAINVPDLSDAARKAYEASSKANAELANDSNTTDYAKARWFTHESLARLSTALADAKKDTAAKLNLCPEASADPVVYVVTLRSDGTVATGSVDLVNIYESCFLTPSAYTEGKDRDEFQKAFNAMYGLSASVIEGEVLPGNEGIGYLDVWAALPENEGLVTISNWEDERLAYAQIFKEKGYPEYLIAELETKNYGFVVPTAPAVIDGKARYAWLEINPETMETISVFDTGEHSGMAAYVLGLTPKNAAEFTCGALIGISCSHFSVAAYSLEFEDYDEIMKNAGELAKETYKALAKFKGDLKEAQEFALNPIGKTGEKLCEAYKEQTGLDVSILYDEAKKRLGVEDGDDGGLEDEPGFVEGFKCVIEAYFGIEIEDD